MTTAQNGFLNMRRQAKEMAGEIPTEVNEMAAAIAQKAKQAMGSLGTDMTHVIRGNPIPAVLVALGVGYLFARVFNRS